jgi:hypothetical protein
MQGYIVRLNNKDLGNGCTGGTIEVICGDCLISLDECQHAKEYRK